MAEPEQCEVVVEPPETGEANAACQEEAEEADREFEPMSNGLPDVQIEDVGSERLGEIEVGPALALGVNVRPPLLVLEEGGSSIVNGPH